MPDETLTLEQLAERIRGIGKHGKLAVGQYLLLAKEQCKHGEWLAFLKTCGDDFSERTAQYLMSYARELKNAQCADLDSLPTMTELGIRKSPEKLSAPQVIAYLSTLTEKERQGIFLTVIKRVDQETESEVEQEEHNPLNELVEKLEQVQRKANSLCTDVNNLSTMVAQLDAQVMGMGVGLIRLTVGNTMGLLTEIQDTLDKEGKHVEIYHEAERQDNRGANCTIKVLPSNSSFGTEAKRK